MKEHNKISNLLKKYCSLTNQEEECSKCILEYCNDN